MNENIVVPSHEFKFKAGNKIFLQERDLDPLSVVSRLWCGWLIRDRFGILNKYSPYRMIDEVDTLPSISDTPLVFSDILDEKISSIISERERIAVSWSGGVDSTAVVVALLKNLPETEWNRITVVCSPSSLEEAPRFYNLLLKSGINVNVSKPLVDAIANVECDAVLSGWCADQLFGSDILARDASLYHKPWLDALKITFDSDFSPVRLTEKSFDVLGEIYSDYAKQLGLDISEWCEFSWLFNFGIKFSYIQNAMSFTLHGTQNEGKAVNVFDDFKFQSYAVNNIDQIKTNNGYDDPVYYKLPLKQYIHEYTNDDEYFTRKGKRNSWMYTKTRINNIKVLTDVGYKTFKYDKDAEELNYGVRQLSYGVGDSFRKDGR